MSQVGQATYMINTANLRLRRIWVQNFAHLKTEYLASRATCLLLSLLSTPTSDTIPKVIQSTRTNKTSRRARNR